MHRRTLDRRLQRHGLRYSELLESVQADIARQLLVDTTMPVQDVAEALRFSNAANFATAFRRWTGVTPSEFRRSMTRGRPARPGVSLVDQPPSGIASASSTPDQHEHERPRATAWRASARRTPAHQEQQADQDGVRHPQCEARIVEEQERQHRREAAGEHHPAGREATHDVVALHPDSSPAATCAPARRWIVQRLAARARRSPVPASRRVPRPPVRLASLVGRRPAAGAGRCVATGRARKPGRARTARRR